MTKLLMVIPSLKTGGAERIFSFIVNNLDKDKFDLYLILFDARDVQFNIDREQITVIDLKKESITKGVFSFIKHLKKIKPDVVFSTITHLNILIGLIGIFFRKKKIVVREVSVISFNNQHQPYPKIFNFLVRLSYNRLDTIICQSEDMADDLVNNFGVKKRKIVIINNPITSDKGLVKGPTDGIINFLSVGRLIPTKGFERLIDVVSKFQFDFKYFIAGDGAQYLNLKNKVKEMKLQEKVILLGNVDVLAPLYQSADFYLHGSYYEGFPNALLEAASHGIPIISYDTPGGINEIIVERFNGLIADSDEDYYNTVLTALKHTWNRTLIQKDIYDRFGKNKILSAYENVLSNC